ncbi:hypothetical protein KW805_02675 [Candidatus Pacearchaeota archaeon]|nr:hypothetical protein [Candidatus Pacearchaeota archaeon]
MEYLNRRGSIGEILHDHIIYLILVALFVAGMSAFLYLQMNGAGLWGDYYTKQIALLIDQGKPGDEFHLDVGKAVSIAQKNGVSDVVNLFVFSNENNEVCARLSPSGKSCVSYFNDVKVIGVKTEFGVPNTVLSFRLEKNG